MKAAGGQARGEGARAVVAEVKRVHRELDKVVLADVARAVAQKAKALRSRRAGGVATHLCGKRNNEP
jgi:hypothetical protein